MDYNIIDFGAKAEKDFNNAQAIQRAIDACHINGGGRVVISNGVYTSGSFELKSNVNLHIREDGVLLGSPNCEDYLERKVAGVKNNDLLPRSQSACFIFAQNAENISITGNGIIDCNGDKFVVPIDSTHPRWYGYPYLRINAKTPPRVVFFMSCKKVKIQDISLTNLPSGWGYWINGCEDVIFNGAKVLSSTDYINNDGIHINSSKNVYIDNCTLVCGDDCIAIRTNNTATGKIRACENIFVTNCSMISNAYCIRLGWHNDGVIKNCVFSNLVMHNSINGVGIYLPNIPKIGRATDQGIEKTRIENILCSNIVMDEIYGFPISISIPSAEDEKCLMAECDKIDNLRFENIVSKGMYFPCLRSAKKGVVKKINFNGCTFTKVDKERLLHYKTNSVAVHHYENFNRIETFDNIDELVLNDTNFVQE